MPDSPGPLRRLFSRAIDEEGHPRATLVLHSGAILVLSVLVELGVRLAAHMPEESYEGPFILGSALLRPHCIPVLLLTGLLAASWKHLRWQRFPRGRLIRLTVVVVAGILAWKHSTYEYNVYYDRAHHLDRVLLVLLAAAIWRHPCFTPLMLLLATAIPSQLLATPGMQFNWTDSWPLYQLLMLFTAFMAYRVVVRRHDFRLFVFLSLCLIATHYFAAGLEKVRLDWLSHNDFSLLVPAAYDAGWLGFLEESTVLRLTNAASGISGPLSLLTLVLELSAIVLVCSRRFAIPLLVGLILMHVGIFVASGIFFWKWILLDIVLIAVLFRLRPADIHVRCKPWFATLACVGIVIAGQWLLRPSRLGWFDTALSCRFQLEAVGESGRVYEVEPAYMAPYELTFAQGRFFYLSGAKNLTWTYGATMDLAMLQALEGARTASDVRRLEDERGIVSADEAEKERLRQFLHRYFTNLNQRGSKGTVWMLLGAPQHIWNLPHRGQVPYREQEPVTELRVTRRLMFTLERQRILVDEERVLEIDLRRDP